MSVTFIDLIDQDSAVYTKRGWETVTRKAIVAGLETSLNGYQKILAAFNDLGLDIGYEHPAFENNYIRSINPVSVASDQVEFIIVYEQMSGFADEISGGGSLTQIETNKDRNDATIILSYTYPADYDVDSKYAGVTDEVSKLIQTDQVVAPFNVKRRVIYDTFDKPNTLSLQYSGKVNQTKWLIFSAGNESRKWKCLGINYEYVGPAIIGGAKKFVYDMQYQFQYKEDLWNENLVYTDPNTGNPPKNATPEVKEILKEEDFNNLLSELIT